MDNKEFKLGWTDFYLGLAFATAAKSPDKSTKNGCVITDNEHRVLGLGYNGYPRGFDDASMPTERDGYPFSKYEWTTHAEVNAIANCEHRPQNAIAYLTSLPCINCVHSLYQFGVRKVIAGPRISKMFDQNMSEWLTRFCTESEKSKYGKFEVEFYTNPNLSWLKNLTNDLDDGVL